MILRNVVSDGATVPGLWPLEVGNILLLAERRRFSMRQPGRITSQDLSRLPIDDRSGDCAARVA